MLRRLPALAVLVLTAGFAGCSPGEDGAPAAAPPPTSAAPGTSTLPGASGLPGASPQVDDPPGAITCDRVVRAMRAATLMEPGVVTDVVQASGTADAPVAEAAQRLATAHTAAVAAQGTDSEPDAVAAVSAAAAEMVSVCADSGLETTG